MICVSHLRFSFKYDIIFLTSCIIAIILTLSQPVIAVIWTYFSKFDSGELAPGWPHFSLLSISVLASFAVGAGIIFERPTYPASVHRIAFWLVIGGIAIEALCTIFLFVFDEGISAAQQSKISDLDTQLVARTKELLTVRKLTADRSLTPEEQKSLIKALTPFAGQPAKIVMFPVNFETDWIAFQIYGVLANAHWTISSPERLLRPVDGMLVQGSFIEASDDDASQRAADALFEALKTTGVPSGKIGKGHPQPPFDPTKPLVWMLIGDKPVPILDWIK
jgi:hypothetical protein